MAEKSFQFWYPAAWMSQMTLTGTEKNMWVIVGEGHLENDFSGELLCDKEKQQCLEEAEREFKAYVNGKSYKERQSQSLCKVCAERYKAMSSYYSWEKNATQGKTFQLPQSQGVSNDKNGGSNSNSKASGSSARSKKSRPSRRSKNDHPANAG